MRPEGLNEKNSRVWDMVLNLVHPAALYVLFQLLLMDRLGRSPLLHPYGPLHPVSLAIYFVQFLGAWTVFYTTLLRDMGYPSAWGTVLVLVALAGSGTAFFAIDDPDATANAHVIALLGPQLVLALVGWPLTWSAWRRERRAALGGDEGAKAGTTPATPRSSEGRNSALAALPLLVPAWQQLKDGVPAYEKANDWFYDVWIWVLAIVPLTIAILLAARKRKKATELPHVTDMTFETEVFESEFPVVLHAYHAWSIGDRVIENQVVRLGDAAHDRLRTLWLDIDKCPGIVSRFPTLGEKCVALFIGRKLAWQAQGVHDHLTMLAEIDPILTKEFGPSAGAAPAAPRGANP